MTQAYLHHQNKLYTMFTNHRVVHAATKFNRTLYIQVNTVSTINNSGILSPFSSVSWFWYCAYYTVQLTGTFELNKSTVFSHTCPLLLHDKMSAVEKGLLMFTYLKYGLNSYQVHYDKRRFFLDHAFVPVCVQN